MAVNGTQKQTNSKSATAKLRISKFVVDLIWVLVETTIMTRALPKMPTMAIIVKATGTITVVRWFCDGSLSYKKWKTNSKMLSQFDQMLVSKGSQIESIWNILTYCDGWKDWIFICWNILWWFKFHQGFIQKLHVLFTFRTFSLQWNGKSVKRKGKTSCR